MAMVCPQCSRSFDRQWNCPECGARLQFQTEFGRSSEPPELEGHATSQWQETPWGRMAVGLLLSQGLAYGLQQLFTAGLIASGEEASVWRTLWGLVLLHALQGIGLLIGGAISGAGRRQGVLYGAFVGLLNGIIFLVVQNHAGETLTEIALYGQPLLHMAFGALGGLIGTTIWTPIPSVQVPEVESKPVAVPVPTWKFLAGPIYPGRVCLGTIVVVVGAVWSNFILNWVVDASRGTLEVRSHLQAQLLGWEITALATLFGAGLAGVSTLNGFKQGLCVGVGASLIMIGIHLGTPRITLETTVFLVGCIMTLSAVGGWFGGSLFPPVFHKGRKSLYTD